MFLNLTNARMLLTKLRLVKMHLKNNIAHKWRRIEVKDVNEIYEVIIKKKNLKPS
jgi:hypothetical protein